MNTQFLPAFAADDVPAWQQSVVAFLAEKERRSGSRRTVESYARMLWPFLTRVGSPDRVTAAHVLAWAHGISASGREPSSATVGARIACLSSYYRFLIRMDLATSNPCDALERPRAVQAVARGYSADEIRRLLAVIPDSVAGRRDRALLLMFVLTGRRRAEVLALAAGDLDIGEAAVFYSYRGKGGKRGRRELPAPAYAAVRASLADIGKDPATMAPDESLWQAGTTGRGISSATFYGRFRRYLRAAGLPPTGLHVLRHSAAKLRRDAGEPIESVSAFLDHSSLAVTTIYLRRLEGEVDRAWPQVAVAIGL
ncbi:MAG TPA: tyrosine-type recombinase/integrase [Candidatus Limnocylindrales bacterium]|nr:tyrosine-type recombinase/integrase [Candidatus Limnocylindrales bacterium]